MSDTNKFSPWSTQNLRIGQLLLAVGDMQSFIHDNWTSAQARHGIMPTSENHWTRSQMRHSSLLAVHARPVPNSAEDKENNAAVEICVRRKKLSEAWKAMQSCDAELWADVCNLYSMVAAVEQNPEKFSEDIMILDEVAEARSLMHRAEILYAVETIKSYDQDEWKDIQETPYISTKWASKQIHRGSLLTVHEHHHDQSPIESKVRHAEHAEAWQKMKDCDKAEWSAACHYHEEINAKRMKLDAAVSIIQYFNTANWTSAHLRHRVLPASEPHWTATQIHHGASLVVRARPLPEPENNDLAYQSHKEKLNDAWETMKKAGSSEWIKACKSHEDFIMANKRADGKDYAPKSIISKATTLKHASPISLQKGIVRVQPPIRNGVGGHAA